MSRAAIPENETGRLAALRACDVLDTPPELAFNDITSLAASICGAPVSLVSFIDENRQWFKSTFGVELREMPREIAICSHAIISPVTLVIPDAAVDPRTSDNPLITQPPHVRFYAGTPLMTADGFALGTLCVVDVKPRTLTAEQIHALEQLGRQVVAQVMLRKRAREFESQSNALQLQTRRMAEVEDQLRLNATHDKLTGLGNRSLLIDRMQQALDAVRSNPRLEFATLFLDFDRFKLTNDTLGHEAGDELLKQISQRLRAALRAHDALGNSPNQSIVSRLGGDEFVVILERFDSPNDVAKVADRLLDALSFPYDIFGCSVVSSASIGIVHCNARYERAEDILRDADIAMYEAKAAGKGRHVIFDEAMHQRIADRMNLETDLRDAIAADELTLAYQPVISLSDGTTRGMEALLRWKHATRGNVSPDEMIPIAEETGLILPIGEWVLRKACAQFSEWQRTLGPGAPPTLSVNLSRKQLTISHLPALVKSILDEYGVSPACLHLEVTESAVMKDLQTAKRILKELQDIGVKVDLDDFGTGHSSLSMLHQIPIDVLKIDKSFVCNLQRGREFVALVHAIAQLARNLGMTIIAEGIETVDQLTMLQTIDCELGQGYYFSKPMSAEATTLFLKRETRWNSSAPPKPLLDVA